MASSCKHAPLQERLTHGNTMPAFPLASGSGGTFSPGCPGVMAGTAGRAPAAQQATKPLPGAWDPTCSEGHPLAMLEDTLGCLLTTRTPKSFCEMKCLQAALNRLQGHTQEFY